MVYKLVLTFESTMVSFLNVLYFFPDWLCHFTEKYFLVVLFIMLYKVTIVIFETLDGFLRGDHSNEAS